MASLLNNASLLLNPAGSIIAYEEDKIFSVLPSNGAGDFTFTGGDGGTRVNQQGYIEQTPANINTYSEKFGTGYWNNFGGTITDDSVIAPNGTVTGTTFNGSPAGVYKTFPGIVPGQVYTVSMYVKLGTATNCVIIINNTQAWNTVGGKSFTSADGLNTTDWTRISFTFTGPAFGAINWHIGYQFESGVTQQTNGTYFVWGAMLNIGSTAKPYQPTTDRLNYPRITYQNGRGAILNEPQKTNLVLYSQQFDVSGWVQYNSATITPSSSLSPDGTQNAYSLNVATTGYSGLYRGVSGGTGIATVSGFFKKGTIDWVLLVNTAGNDGVAWFNLANGTIGTVDAGYSATIEPFKDGWYRCSMTGPSQNIAIWQIAGATSDNNPTPAYAGNIYIWGAQVETDRFASSYIPTTSATVTRTTGNVRKTGVSSYIGQTEGTLYTDFVLGNQWEDGSTGADQNLLTISDGSYNNVVMTTVYPAVGNILMYAVVGNSIQVSNVVTGILVPGRRYKTALAYKQNDYALYLNGVQISTDTSATVPACSQVDITQNLFSGAQFSNPPGTAAIFTSRLNATQLAELTTIRSGSGGNISYYGPYTIHTFTGSATFTPSFSGQVEVLVVAGGGGGGSGADSYWEAGGGGGAGGLLYASSYGVSQGTGITVTIGAGGAGGLNHTFTSPSNRSGNGSNSVFGGLTAIGGGGGGGAYYAATDGGSGGGEDAYYGTNGNGVVGQGNNGGVGNGIASTLGAGGGGGGAGSVGSNGQGSGNYTGGAGGIGLPYSISGFSTYYAGGGGGKTAVAGSGAGGAGGLGGGGNGGVAGGSAVGSSGVNYTGGGGGGGLSTTTATGAGGAGVVIVRYLT
jgi:hypothetical protein